MRNTLVKSVRSSTQCLRRTNSCKMNQLTLKSVCVLRTLAFSLAIAPFRPAERKANSCLMAGMTDRLHTRQGSSNHQDITHSHHLSNFPRAIRYLNTRGVSTKNDGLTNTGANSIGYCTCKVRTSRSTFALDDAADEYGTGNS